MVATLEQVFRDEWGRVLASLIGFLGDFELAEEERLELDSYHYLHATRADLLRRSGRIEDARAAYDRALELVHSDAERRFLQRRQAELQPDRIPHHGLGGPRGSLPGR